jgi:hypothetical protein
MGQLIFQHVEGIPLSCAPRERHTLLCKLIQRCSNGPRSCGTIEPVPYLSSQRHRPPRAHKVTLYIFLCSFGPTNPDFDMLHCHIALISCIAFVLLQCFDVLQWHIALICYIATLLWYATLLLFCNIALIAILLWYATLPLTCHIALICYIATFLEVHGRSLLALIKCRFHVPTCRVNV